MSNRDEFGHEVRRALAERAGHRCSFPDCPAVTIGPSDESEIAVSKTGMACHIAAASGGPGARRYVADMSSEKRSSIDNGVWMCYTHGKLVDTDETRFSMPMLTKWRQIAELRAQWVSEYGLDRPLPQYVIRGRLGFAEEHIRFRELGNENELVGTAFVDCCIETELPEDVSRTVRDLVVELIRNALTHGRAKECSVDITKEAIYVSDDGVEFSCLDLNAHPNGRGGAGTLKYLLSKYDQEIVLGAKREKDRNETMLAPAGGLKGVLLTKPCCVFLDRKDWQVIKAGALPAAFADASLSPCRIVYIRLPKFSTLSDAHTLQAKISPDILKGKQIVFVAEGASQNVRANLEALFPNCRVLVPR
jgi:hypothetical protein